MATTSVLVADDNAEEARELADRAKGDSWDVSTASSADATRRALEERPVALLLADAAIWNRGGLGAYVGEKHAALPVIVLTSADETASGLVHHLQLGAMTYVPRAAGRRQLVETIQSILDLARRNPYRDRVKGYLSSADIELQVDNDPSAVAVIVGYLQRVLEDYGLSLEKECFRFGVALGEAMSNAIIHGNLEIGSEMRDSNSDAYYDAIEQRRTEEPYTSRHVQVRVRFSRSSATFVIRDQGKGFDPVTLSDPTDPANIAKASGRGILLMKAYSDLVSWNETGNEVTLVKSLTA